MDACDLTKKKCVPCEGGIPALTDREAQELAKKTPKWRLPTSLEVKAIVRDFEFKNFLEAMDFVNDVAKIAEAEGHHPDVLIHQYKKVRITLWTHAVKGLTENDFILAAKIDEKLP